MKKNKIENIVIVRNNTRLEQLVQRFNTQSQAKFYMKQQKVNYLSKQSINPFSKSKANAEIEIEAEAEEAENDFNQYEEENSRFYTSLSKIQDTLSKRLKTKVIEANFLSNYLFTERDLIVVIGQDGLVANTAKYVNRIPIVAINPDPEQYDGILLPFNKDNFIGAVDQVLKGDYNFTEVTMGEAKLDDGQRLLSFNDFFIGPLNHTSARYKITYRYESEDHSSSGVIVSTGAGSTGWLSSLFNMVNGMNRTFAGASSLKQDIIPHDANELVFVVREPFKSKTSQADIIAGKILQDEKLIIESYMPHNGVIFSDGIQTDFIAFNSGAIVEIGIAPEKAILVKP